MIRLERLTVLRDPRASPGPAPGEPENHDGVIVRKVQTGGGQALLDGAARLGCILSVERQDNDRLSNWLVSDFCRMGLVMAQETRRAKTAEIVVEA
jgi:hypothetical protein